MTTAMRRAHDMSAGLVGDRDRDGVTVRAGGEAIAQYELNRQCCCR
ncbi:hypothetical protein [Nocardia sp. alder85J]|nr:hypothetical protein [Nocardia sp. alder85J]MCX4098156.1 hypothetical protein [Nocardia sp. alder85J]